MRVDILDQLGFFFILIYLPAVSTAGNTDLSSTERCEVSFGSDVVVLFGKQCDVFTYSGFISLAGSVILHKIVELLRCYSECFFAEAVCYLLFEILLAVFLVFFQIFVVRSDLRYRVVIFFFECESEFPAFYVFEKVFEKCFAVRLRAVYFRYDREIRL